MGIDVMVNIANQRPGDIWIIGGDRYEVLVTSESVLNDGEYIYMRHMPSGKACIVAILPRTSDEVDALIEAAGL